MIFRLHLGVSGFNIDVLVPSVLQYNTELANIIVLLQTLEFNILKTARVVRELETQYPENIILSNMNVLSKC